MGNILGGKIIRNRGKEKKRRERKKERKKKRKKERKKKRKKPCLILSLSCIHGSPIFYFFYEND